MKRSTMIALGSALLGGGGASAPEAPTNLAATPFSTSRIDLSWTDNATNETEYRVYRSTDNVSFSLLATIAASSTSYQDSTVTSGTAYYYKVAAYNAAGESITAAVSANTLTLSLISYWKLDESSGGTGAVTRNDSVGTNHLTDNNTVASGTGKIGNAASLVAANSERLSVASNATLQAGDIDLTLACWVNMANLVSSGLVGKWGTATNREYTLFYNTTDHVPNNRFTFAVSNDGTASTVLDATTFGAASANTWYFVVAWHDSVADTINIQINNGTVDSAAHTTGIAVRSSAFNLGAIFGGSYFLNGRIDEVPLWKRVLTSDERTKLYDAGSGVTYPFLP